MSTITVELVPGWDAALTYDVLAARADGRGDEPVFVGREDLLGPLVNAISQPDRRGTYLVSGYRGAGKTSLVIEAARRAQPRLEREGRRLLPLVLNVSEVSASLESASDKQMPPLGIDARRLLTALLRALRNSLGTDDPAAEMVRRAYAKAEASRYTETAQQRAEASRSVAVETQRSVTVANGLKLLGVGAGVLAIGAEGAALLGGVQAVAVALAAVAAISFGASRRVSSTSTDSELASTELVFDNSLHQVESDLKDILAALAAHGTRTMFVLEELDKVEDEHGQQLDAVIRYFKNLFTQAPALFFFLTDKGYFDVIGDNIASARRARSYAVEHTFFTHRVFVSRPSLDECLAYFRAVLAGDDARTAVDQIAATRHVRSRPLSEMPAVERFLRVLLFWSQNHLFDLKNEMRRYVRVDDAGQRLAFDEDSLPPQEQAVAALHFALEQKALLYRFGGGRDYENEVLRNCLSGVFASVGATDAQPLRELYPEPGELRLAERGRIVEAVDSLLGDLQRGGAIELGATGDASFSWHANAAVTFNPAPTLEPHEQALQAQLERASRVCAQFAAGAPLAEVGVDPRAFEAQIAAHAATIEEIRRASRPLTIEDAQQRSAEVGRGLTPLLASAHSAHFARLGASGWVLLPPPVVSAENLWMATRLHEVPPWRVHLVYGTDAAMQTSVLRALATLPPGVPAAVVLVDEDPEPPRAGVLSAWRAALADADRAVLVTTVPLAEELPTAAAVGARWGERTAEALLLARLWLGQRDYLSLPATYPVPEGPAWLARGAEEQRYETLPEALAAWLAGSEALLGAPPRAGNDGERLLRAFADLAGRSERPVLLLDGREWLPQPLMDDDYAVRERLLAAGRVLTLVNVPYVPQTGRSVLLLDLLPLDVPRRPPTMLRTLEEPQALRALAEFVEPGDRELAGTLLEQAARGGDPEAMGQLVVRHQRAGDPQRAQEWIGGLLATRDREAIFRAGNALPRGDQASGLLEDAANLGSAEAMASLLIQGAVEWKERLLATGNWAAIRRAAAGVEDAAVGAGLLAAAADAGDVEALDALARRDASGRWDEPLIELGGGLRLWQVAEALDPAEPERGLRFHRAAADKGDIDSMREVLVRGDEDESRVNEARLLERADWGRLEAAAARLEDERPERAAELRALVAKGQAGDQVA